MKPSQQRLQLARCPGPSVDKDIVGVPYTSLDDILERDRGSASTAELAPLRLTRTLAHQGMAALGG